MRWALNAGPIVRSDARIALDPPLRDAVAVALVEERDDLVGAAAACSSAPSRASCAAASSSTSPESAQPLRAVVGLRPPAVEHAQVEAAVDRRLHAARAARLERRPRQVQPDVAALHEQRAPSRGRSPRGRRRGRRPRARLEREELLRACACRPRRRGGPCRRGRSGRARRRAAAAQRPRRRRRAARAACRSRSAARSRSSACRGRSVSAAACA